MNIPQEFLSGQAVGMSPPALLIKRYHANCNASSQNAVEEL